MRRKISQDIREKEAGHFRMGKMRKAEPEIVSLFEREILFIEDLVQYWLPVQNELFAFLRSG